MDTRDLALPDVLRSSKGYLYVGGADLILGPGIAMIRPIPRLPYVKPEDPESIFTPALAEQRDEADPALPPPELASQHLSSAQPFGLASLTDHSSCVPKRRATFHLPVDLLDELRDAVQMYRGLRWPVVRKQPSGPTFVISAGNITTETNSLTALMKSNAVVLGSWGKRKHFLLRTSEIPKNGNNCLWTLRYGHASSTTRKTALLKTNEL